MIKREHIKQAIDAIGTRALDIGRALDELLGVGRIDAPSRNEDAASDTDFFFFFDKEKVRVKKFIFINEGTAPIERGLLIKYGELQRKREFLEHQRERDLLKAAREVRRAGLQLMVHHEIDYAISRLLKEAGKGRPDGNTDAVLAALHDLKAEDPPRRLPDATQDEGVIFAGSMEGDRPALFIRFPFCLEALMQVADINLEFFHVRFLLGCLLRGLEKHLFACVVDRRIVGMLFLGVKTALFYSGLEIKYVATLRGRRGEDEALPPRGVGRFLVAGTWLLWKTVYPSAREIILDSEIGARRFYEHHGFSPKGAHRYILSRPSPDLLRTILMLVENIPDLPPKVTVELSGLVVARIKSLRRRYRSDRDRHLREPVDTMVQTALASRTHPAIAAAATRALLRYGRGISELDHLIELAGQNPEIRKSFAPTATVFGVAWDDRFRDHLADIFHLENPKRYEAIRSVFQDSSVAGRMKTVAPRAATPEELAWVHTPEYIARVADTAGRPLTSFDLDTQTTEKSFETACLAAGAVFNLVEEIWSGKISRGFAAVRPPGHHAEPDRGMGFCLFNNVALGARYLQERHGVKRIMVVDIDAHHGNGTQAVFYDTDEVLCVSIHQFPGFPGTGKLGEVGRGKGKGYTVNVPLRKGHGDRDFLCILHFLVRPLAKAYQPEIILVPCGFDLWTHDRLAEMRVSAEGYGLMTALLVDIAAEVCSGRIAFVMEGGYSAEGIRECGLKVLQSLCLPSPSNLEILQRVAAESPGRLGALKKAIEIHRSYWDVLK